MRAATKAAGKLWQVGEFDIVLDVGSKVLEKWEARSMRRDILFAMALAHCGLATEALDAKDKVFAAAVRRQPAIVLHAISTVAGMLSSNFNKQIKEQEQEHMQ
jgi:hypothetical protein